MKLLLHIALGAGLVGIGSGPSSASTLSLTFDSVAPSVNVSASLDKDRVDQGPFSAGALNMQSLDSNGVIENFVAWCIEVLQVIALKADYDPNPTFETVEEETRMTRARETLISKLFTGFLDETTSDIGAAAFQLAIWEILEEDSGSFDLRQGRFAATSTTAWDVEADPDDAVVNTANGWLARLGGFEANYRIRYLLSEDSQDLITATPVPLPASFLLLGAGVGTLAFVRRRARARTLDI